VIETSPLSFSSAVAAEVEAVVEEDAGKGFTVPGPAANDAKLVGEM
jgi:hypothetical protein